MISHPTAKVLTPW